MKKRILLIVVSLMLILLAGCGLDIKTDEYYIDTLFGIGRRLS